MQLGVSTTAHSSILDLKGRGVCIIKGVKCTFTGICSYETFLSGVGSHI